MATTSLARLKVFFAAVFWGASFVATKAALREIQPITLIVLRFALGILILAFVVWRSHIWRWLDARDYIFLVFLGALAIAFHQGLQATGLLFTSASNMAWLVALTPVFTALLARLFLREIFGWAKIIGLAIAFSGALLVVTQGVLTPSTLRLPGTLGDFLALASALNWAIFSVASKPMLRRLPPTLMMACLMFFGWLLVLPFFVAMQGWNDVARLTAPGWVAVGYLGVFCSGIAYLFWYDALAVIDASQATAFIYLEPFVTVVVAALLLDETFTPVAFLGGLAIIVGVYLVNRPIARRVQAVTNAGD